MSLDVSSAEQLKDIFIAFDTDHNGTLDTEEFKHFLDESGEEYDDEIINELYAVFDKDHDGKITFEEFIAYVKCVQDEDETALLKYRFDCIDLDHNGTLDANELQQFEKLCGNILTDEEAEQLLKQMDKDGDGKVTLQDFINYKSN